MGYPLRYLSDLFNNKEKIAQLNANFYSFLLYKEEHTEFRELVRKNFNYLHNRSGNSVLFIFDYIEDWLQRKDIQYYNDIQGIDYQPGLSNKEVEEVCKHFKVHSDSLPALVLFKNFTSKNCTIIHLRELTDENGFLQFFNALFMEGNIIGLGKDFGSGNTLFIKENSPGYKLHNLESQSITFNRGNNIENILNQIFNIVQRIEGKVDIIMETINNLQNEIEVIKSTKRRDEEKLLLIHKKIDYKFLAINKDLKEDVKAYEDLLKELIEDWDHLDQLSKEMLPIADYLYDQLSRLKDADYSPVILQYCRTMENEFLKKLFVEFTLYITKNEPQLETFLAKDLENNKTCLFAKRIKNFNENQNSEKIKFTLGEMGRILEYTAGKNTIKQSPLLQEFKKYILAHFGESDLLSKDFLQNIKQITEEYRNKCAHPSILKEEDALYCKEFIPSNINNFISYYKQRNKSITI